MLEVSDVSVRFGGLLAVNQVSMAIKDAQVRGIIGPNGAGKTTFFNAISGLVAHTGGSIHLDTEDITALPADRRAAVGIRRTFQSVQLIAPMTVLENVLVGLHTRIAGPSWGIGAILRLSRREREAQEAVVEVLDFVGLPGALLTPVEELSFSQQRLVEIARAIIARPKLLMLDEPAAGLSGAELARLNGIIRRLRDEWGMSIMLVEHVLSVIFDVSDEVSVLHNGALIWEGPPTQVANDAGVRAAYLGESRDAVAHGG
jgi:branched-chain amino acid transport system ATP-binding protein